MLKITVQENHAGTVLELQGKIAGPWVEELKTCWQKTAVGPPVKIHLCAVTYIDGQGKNLLTEMYRRGADLVAEGCMTKAIVDEIARGGRS